MEFKNFILDNFQEEAIKAIEENSSVVVSAPTGSGKTLIAEYIIDKNIDKGKRIIYTAPIKALSNQKYRDFSREYGESQVGLMTGDIVINPSAQILIMTTEIYRNMALAHDYALTGVAYVIFDEIHFINDVERGYVWEESIIYSSELVRFLCLSATIPNAPEFSRWISSIKKHQVKTIIATKRNVPLKQFFYDEELGITTLERIRDEKKIPRQKKVGGRWIRKRVPPPNHLELIRELGKEKLPCFYFCFSRHACQEKALELSRKNLFKHDLEVRELIGAKLRGAPYDINKLDSVKSLRQTLPQGIGFHHAGLLPLIKELVEELFSLGKLKVLYTTETFAVGINMPAKTVCFDSLRKFDGRGFRNLNTKEYFQIAGRAGRRGIDKVGYAIAAIYRPTFNYEEIKRLTSKDLEPIKSRFWLSVNTVLNLIEQHEPKEIEKILRLSFFSYQKFGENYAKIPAKVLMARYNSIVRQLKKYDFISEENSTVKSTIKLTAKGRFSSRIFADEFAMGEIFATSFVSGLDEYQLLLVLGALIYEPKEMNKFFKDFDNEQLQRLERKLNKNDFLRREKKFDNFAKVAVMIYPIYMGKSFFDALELTNLLEGDLIRFYAQLLDRLGQIRKAGIDSELRKKIDNCEEVVRKALEGVWMV